MDDLEADLGGLAKVNTEPSSIASSSEDAAIMVNEEVAVPVESRFRGGVIAIIQSNELFFRCAPQRYVYRVYVTPNSRVV